jgi:hypothetical protein
MKQMMMIVPVDANVYETQDITQQDGNERPQGSNFGAVRNLHSQYHDGDDDGKKGIAKIFEATFMHV